MDKKITIKDIATELGVDTQSILREAKQLNIAAKTSTSSLSEEDAKAVRKHYSKEAATKSTPSEGVIVRRKRNSVEPQSTQAEAKQDDKPQDKASTEKAVKETTLSDEKKAKAQAKEVQGKEAQALADTKEEKVAKVTKKESKEEKGAAKTSDKTAEKKTEKKAVEKVEKAEKAEKAEEKKVKTKKEISQSTARIITPVATAKPAEVKEVVQEPINTEAKEVTEAKDKADDKKKSASISAKPDGTSTSSILPPAGEKSFAQRVEPEIHEPRSQVRVISKPSAEQISRNESQNRENRDREKRPFNRDNRSQNDRGDRNDRPFNRDGRPHERSDRPFNRDARPNDRNARPQNDRGGSDRPQGGARGGFNAPGGFNKDKDADTRPRTQAPRPQKPRTSMDLPFPVAEEQSRKKRNKNKKTNEFSESTPQTDFKMNKYMFGMEDDDSPRRRRKPKKKDLKSTVTTTAPMKAAKRKIRIEEAIRVADMAHQMGLKSSEIIKILFGLGVMATINSSLDFDTASVVAAEFEYEVEKVGFSAEEAILPTEVDAPEMLKVRPPVVTIMGHVDHGKTSLLDAIRQTNVTDGEAGGITQHIGAYHVRTKRGEIVFLDTPGHEAFTAMRLRGAQVTDIVVLVVAADDGVMEQTREAINHAKAAEVPIIVAVNKMDKEGANPDRVLRELAELGLQAEDWGGDTVTTMLSAKKREGIDELLELITLQAELMELKANPDKHARGHIVEAKLDKGRGPVATVLIQEGTLNQGDSFVCGVFAGRVRALFNDQGKKILSAGPSIPVEVQGFEGVPEAGEEFVSLQDERMARRIADARAVKLREKVLAKESKVTLETFLARKADTAEALVLNLILKADVQGSLEAITEALHKLSTPKVRIAVLHGGAGSISESDIMLAAASEAIVIGFNVKPTAKVKEVADNEHVDIRFYDIIYKLVEEIRAAMAGMLAPVQKEVYLGQAEVRDTFSLSKVGTIAGVYIVDGKLTRHCGVRLLREGVVIYTGKISSLKRFKDDAKEVMKGFECGTSLENYNDIKIGDIIEAFEMKEEAGQLD